MTKADLELSEKILNKTDPLTAYERKFVERFFKRGDKQSICQAAVASQTIYSRYINNKIDSSFIEPYVKSMFRIRFEKVKQSMAIVEQKISA